MAPASSAEGIRERLHPGVQAGWHLTIQNHSTREASPHAKCRAEHPPGILTMAASTSSGAGPPPANPVATPPPVTGTISACTCGEPIAIVGDDRKNTPLDEMNIREEILAMKDEIIANRRHLHA